MFITCPSCTAEYDVPGDVAAGRLVRCARCGVKWAPVTDPPATAQVEPEPPPVATPIVVTPPAPLVPPVVRGKPSNWPLFVAWAGSLAVVASLFVAVYLWREPIMVAWPPSIRLFSFLGLA